MVQIVSKTSSTSSGCDGPDPTRQPEGRVRRGLYARTHTRPAPPHTHGHRGDTLQRHRTDYPGDKKTAPYQCFFFSRPVFYESSIHPVFFSPMNRPSTQQARIKAVPQRKRTLASTHRTWNATRRTPRWECPLPTTDNYQIVD